MVSDKGGDVAWLSRDDAGTARLAYLQDWATTSGREIEDLEQSIARLQQIVGSARERVELIRQLAQVVEEELEFTRGPLEPSPEIMVEPSRVIDVDATPPLRVTLPASRPGTEAEGRIEQIVE
jgi:hypothetical protein